MARETRCGTNDAGKPHVPFERRTEASPSMGASSDPTVTKAL